MSATSVKETFVAVRTPEASVFYDFVEAHRKKHGAKPEGHFFLSGPEPGDQVEVPEEIYEVLVQVAEAMKLGQGVTITPRSATLTTQQAADLLGVTRPTVVRLLDQGLIPFEKPNSHRRIKLEDVLAYQAQRREAQYKALDELGHHTPDADDPVETLRAAKKRAAAKRQQRGA